MARARLTPTTQDLISDAGSVLWSFIQGEQLEFEVELSFLTRISNVGYTFEAVVLEAANIAGSDNAPTTLQPAGAATVLSFRVPPEKGTWDPVGSYIIEDVVNIGSVFYKRIVGNTIPTTGTANPALLTEWMVYVPNKVYIQFPSNLGQAWAVQPTVNSSVRGFFELQVTEPAGGVYQRSWKPLRGMVELLYSPTQQVI